MHDAGIPFNVVKYPSFKPFCEAVGQYGPGVKPPSYHKVRVSLLKKEVELTREAMKVHEDGRKAYGCSILSDGWKDRRERTLVNFLVNSMRGSVLVESVNASAYTKTGEKMFELLSHFVEKIGVNNVVQVVTDNASNNVLLRGGILMALLHQLCKNLLLRFLASLTVPLGVNGIGASWKIALRRQYESCDTIDPKYLNDIDDSNKRLTERLDDDNERDDELVFTVEDNLTWNDVAIAAGVGESSYRFRSREASSSRSRVPQQSQVQPSNQLFDEEESEEENEEEDDGDQLEQEEEIGGDDDYEFDLDA
ncbi:hypothetical protein Ddye_030921 [Dipteronia dyeriana]|uniref:DUF659 domain-containing protein n=1 Tax=Dipteronia dyeriana TaxID=168575 RepID=A0AAD9THB2_9ROSI|nr:hypothetical protein Ddye_030921 [Dipteronia dyeriana]